MFHIHARSYNNYCPRATRIFTSISFVEHRLSTFKHCSLSQQCEDVQWTDKSTNLQWSGRTFSSYHVYKSSPRFYLVLVVYHSLPRVSGSKVRIIYMSLKSQLKNTVFGFMCFKSGFLGDILLPKGMPLVHRRNISKELLGWSMATMCPASWTCTRYNRTIVLI